jgi:chemotaxis protein histidine kinase CheA
VTSESNRYVVPLSQVQETINLKSQTVFPDKLGIGSCFELRGTVMPLILIEDAMGERRSSEQITGRTALIVNVEDRPIALVVADVLRAQQIVIKPFTNGIIAQKGWVGTCVLGDGLPTLILSPIDLLSGRITHSLKEANLGGAA